MNDIQKVIIIIYEIYYLSDHMQLLRNYTRLRFSVANYYSWKTELAN